ncbi:F-box/kelch-repeat protein At3g23880-like [Prosopis cineraria]|uniref:F-box/kelch-repeat protein At3g23880-like n=1 Tax=Prosopis cineraria TaxID=364024 RepID=UPI00240FF35F|nr:F-box/kelch-repeat protein At3g23880-like [Prosopis cineraria]
MDDFPPYLPQEIIVNILKRLPVKSLIRFQCVCKHWKHLIKSSYFVSEHLHHSSLQNPCLLFQREMSGDPFILHLLDSRLQVRELQNDFWCAQIVGSSNGLLCIGMGKYILSPLSFLLWNPAIREVRQVPINDFERASAVGFGFSPIINDYKVVRITIGILKSRVDVYSLNTGLWKEINFGKLKDLSFCSNAVTANGTLFWRAFDVKDLDEISVKSLGSDFDLIVSFDIAMELFTLIPEPAIDPDSSAHLVVCENKLAMLCLTFDSFLIDLWVMEEEGTSEFGKRWSWTKKHTIITSSGMLFPSVIWRNEIVCKSDEVVWTSIWGIQYATTILPLLNLSTHKLKKLAIEGCATVYSRIFNHVESLVPVSSIPIEEPSS